MGMLEGKVVLITGGARGQGRAHAVTRAREGADVILVDVAQQMETVPYPMATQTDLDETVSQVEAHDRCALAIQADVRSQAQLDEAVSRGLGELGRIGVITSSTNGIEPGLNYAHYVAAKHGVVGLMKNIALELAPHGIRCNSINPGAIKTPMTDHQGAWDMFAGHEAGTEADMLEGGYHFAALKGTTFMDPQVIADTALYLNSDLAAKVTGVTIPVDAGHLILTGVNQTPVH